MKDQNPSISEDFAKTFLKWLRDGLETTWRKCWSSRPKRVLRKLLRISYRRLKAGFSVCIPCLFVTERVLTETEWNARGANVCSLWSLFICLFWKLLFRTTNVKGKTDHSVSLRWNKKLWSFPERRVFFWLSIQLICFAHFRPAELKPACILLLVVTVTFFYIPRFIYYLCRTIFILLFSQWTLLTHASE